MPVASTKSAKSAIAAALTPLLRQIRVTAGQWVVLKRSGENGAVLYMEGMYPKDCLQAGVTPELAG